MSNHQSALVPLETWCYASPELRRNAHTIDIGLLAEALIYYEQVFVNVGTQPNLAVLINWFKQQNKLPDLITLLQDCTITFYDYAFVTAPIQNRGIYTLVNVQDPTQAQPNTFVPRFLQHRSVVETLPKGRVYNDFSNAVEKSVIEVKADAFHVPIESANNDFQSPDRSSLIVQAFTDELYRVLKEKNPPQVIAKVTRLSGTQSTITWNLNFAKIAELAGPNLNFHLGTPLAGAAVSNKLLWSAAQMQCDLYLPQPMAGLVGDKLYESLETTARAGGIVENLKSEVGFPDIRGLVNSGKLTFDDILLIRKKAKKFRDWLQQESQRDRNAIVAYHHEVYDEIGIVKGSRAALRMFGAIGGGALGGMTGAAAGGPMGAAIGGAVGATTSYLMDITSRIGAGWRPIVFGRWMSQHIEQIMRDRYF